MPCIFYGDEQGLCGISEEEYRQPIKWAENQDKYLFTFYKELINLRKNSEALKYGNYRTLYAKAGQHLYVFSRKYINERVIVALNPSPTPVNWESPKGKFLLKDNYDGKSFSAYGFCILQEI